MYHPVKFRHYLREMLARGCRADDVQAGTGLRAETLSEPACLIDFPQKQTVVSNMILLTGNQTIGLLSSKTPWFCLPLVVAA